MTQITGHTGKFRRASLFDTNIENLDMVVGNGINTYGELGEDPPVRLLKSNNSDPLLYQN